jgi:hypothetical protein
MSGQLINWSLSPTWPPRSDQIYIYSLSHNFENTHAHTYIYMCVCVCVFKIMWQWIYIYICVCVCFQNYVTVKDYLFRFFFFYYITAQIIYLNWATLASSDQISLKTSASYNNIRHWPFLPILKEWLLYNH